MSAKLRIKAKGIEIEWEGEVDYLKNDLPDLIAAIISALGPVADDDEDQNDSTETLESGKTFTTAALAAKLKPNSAAELFKVALAKLQISDNLDPVPKAQIHNEMKLAPKFYKPSMNNNLGKTIEGLLGQGVINEPSPGKYTLDQTTYDQLKAQI